MRHTPPAEHDDERDPAHRDIGRRHFLAGGLGAGAMLVGGCGGSAWSPVAAPSLTGGVDAATVRTQASRGQRVQVVEPPARNWRAGQFVMSVDTARRLMALTFDDGPSPYNTDSVLRTLERYGIRATFYLIGVNVLSWPSIARRTAEAGHELGNHSVYHTPYRASALASQIGRNQEIIRDAAGVTPISHRAPGLTRGQSILDTCAYYDLFEVHTHMATYDWLSPRRSAYQLWLDFVNHHRNGAFALYHDGGNRRPTPDALPNIIRSGLDLGYGFVTASELMRSGVPQPVSSTNRYSDTADTLDLAPQGDATDVEIDGEIDGYVDRCNYDAEAELRAALDDVSTTYAERMRIVGVLADIEAAKNAG